MVLVTVNIVAADKCLVKLVVRKSELIEAVLPETHVFEGTERHFIRLHPVGAATDEHLTNLMGFNTECMLWQKTEFSFFFF